MYRLRLAGEDLARVRFAISPLWETAQAVRSLVDPRQRVYHLPWLEQVRSRLPDLDIAPLLAIQPLRGYTPDLITPSPARPRPTVEEQLATLRATPLQHVRRELRRSLTERDRPPPSDEMRELAEQPERARARLADALESCWQALIAPHWPRISDLLDADIAHHSRELAAHGLGRLLPSVHPSMSWREGTLTVRTGPASPQSRDARGQGLLLQPSAFGWPMVAVVTDAPYPPTVVYPARGVAELWQPDPAPAEGALGTLLGRTRAMLLASLRESASTTTLARRHRLARATVSEHLSALREAGLVTTRRNGRAVLYRATTLGEALLAAPEATPTGAAPAPRVSGP